MSLGTEISSCGLHDGVGNRLTGDIIGGAGGCKITIFHMVGSFFHDNFLNGFGDNEIDIPVSLPVSVAAHINRHTIHVKGQVGAMIGVKTPQEKLVGLSCAAGMFQGNKPGSQTEQIRRSALGLKQDILIQNDSAGRCSDRAFSDDLHLL